MYRFQTVLVAGTRRPYNTWTFLVLPPEIARKLGHGRKPIRGTIAGHAFRGVAARGEGVMRVPIPKTLRDEAGLCLGDRLDVRVELDDAPRPIAVPVELRAVLRTDPALRSGFEKLAPSCRRAWATYVGEAKLPETRLRRAERARRGIRARAYPTQVIAE